MIVTRTLHRPDWWMEVTSDLKWPSSLSNRRDLERKKKHASISSNFNEINWFCLVCFNFTVPEPSGEINLKTYPSDQTILQGIFVFLFRSWTCNQTTGKCELITNTWWDFHSTAKLNRCSRSNATAVYFLSYFMFE